MFDVVSYDIKCRLDVLLHNQILFRDRHGVSWKHTQKKIHRFHDHFMVVAKFLSCVLRNRSSSRTTPPTPTFMSLTTMAESKVKIAFDAPSSVLANICVASVSSA
jgi:hypothetical protein